MCYSTQQDFDSIQIKVVNLIFEDLRSPEMYEHFLRKGNGVFNPVSTREIFMFSKFVFLTTAQDWLTTNDCYMGGHTRPTTYANLWGRTYAMSAVAGDK